MQLGSQPGDVAPERTRGGGRGLSPHELGQLLVREDRLGIARERGEQVQLGGRQLKLLVAKRDSLAGEVDHEVPDLQDLLARPSASGPSARLLASTAERGLDARLELARLERLSNEVVGAELQPEHGVGRSPPLAHHDDRGAGACLEACHQHQAVDVRERAVDNEQVRSDGLAERLSLGAAGGHEHLEVGRAQRPAQARRDLLVAFDDQDASAGSSSARAHHSWAWGPATRSKTVGKRATNL